MRTLGLIGGMSWESTASYYRLINEGIKQRLGGLHSARLVLYSVDFADIEALQQAGDWVRAGMVLAEATRALRAAGAEGVLLCTNTMHKVAPAIEAVGLPLIHIADATAAVIRQQGLTQIGLLGTRFTMEQTFYVGRLQRQGIRVLTPDAPGREAVHSIIYQELCLGQTRPASRQRYRAVMADLVAQGAEGIILGCTEIGLLVDASDASVPLFDTTALHADAAVAWMLAS
ncbi:aspartate/glutamate racemase family protein [Pseudaeromonas sharmana]|uniref:Aspartate/glutamate racemase family protein n=1 Tax=Pseudaeromonas sharmana TaxID=328412 RepID=A0ABV8CLA7_9GAMM